MIALEKARQVEELGLPLRARIEAAVPCREWDGVVRDDYTEVLLFAPTQKAVEDALFYRIVGAAKDLVLEWRVAPEVADRTSDQNEIRRDCGIKLWGAYARFRLIGWA